MKTCQRNSCSIRIVVRFGMVILMAMVGLALAGDGTKNSQEDNTAREIRFLPPSMGTARHFGKRISDFQPSNLYRHESMMLLPVKDDSQRFPIDWFIQFLMKNPELANRVERKLLYGDKTLRPSASHRFKKDSDEVTYYFNE